MVRLLVALFLVLFLKRLWRKCFLLLNLAGWDVYAKVIVDELKLLDLLCEAYET